jgi:hypothetical protein
MINKIFTFLVISIILLSAEKAQATTNFSFTPIKINVQQGQIFSLKIDVNPQGVKNYTVKVSIKFPPELVTLKTWTYANNWMPLRQSGYDYFSNASGALIRTAGYPKGFNETIDFGSAEFIAKKNGTGVIEFANDSFSLDKNNFNRYVGGDKSTIIISSSSQTAPETISPPVGEAVEQLFDIVLSIESATLNKSGDLVAKTQFTSFGTVPTLVNMNYRIEDVDGQKVYTENAETTVETEQIVTKVFKNLNIADGKYTLVLSTTYGNNVKDEFKQAFEVKTIIVSEKEMTIWVWVALCLAIVGVGWFVIYSLRKRKIDEQ